LRLDAIEEDGDGQCEKAADEEEEIKSGHPIPVNVDTKAIVAQHKDDCQNSISACPTYQLPLTVY